MPFCAAIVMRVVGHYQIFQFGIAAYFSLCLGLIFWAASDPMFEMVDWLAFPDRVRHSTRFSYSTPGRSIGRAATIGFGHAYTVFVTMPLGITALSGR